MEKAEELKQSDQVRLLEVCQKYTDTGVWAGIFSYPNCGCDLVQQGLVSEEKKITVAGRAVLWFLGKGDDPTDSKAVQEIIFNLKKA